VLLLLATICYTIKNFNKVASNKNLWFSFSILTFIICTGGVTNHLVHNAPWFKYDRNNSGQLYIQEYFMSNKKKQYAAEGYFVSLTVTIIGGLLVALGNLNKLADRGVWIRIITLGCISTIYVLLQLILTCFQFKHGWYRKPSLSPP